MDRVIQRGFKSVPGRSAEAYGICPASGTDQLETPQRQTAAGIWRGEHPRSCGGYGSTYRAVYTVKFQGMVYVLHAFQKKSKKGIATPKHDIDLIKKRLKAATEHYAKEQKGKKP
jgi:hypothetical protein